MKNQWFYMTLVMVFILPDVACYSGVTAFDDVTGLNHPVFVKVLTTSNLFAQGGQLVELRIVPFVEQTLLTGGDGYGYAKFAPPKAGEFKIEVMHRYESATATLLVMAPTDHALVVEIEGGLRSDLFAAEPRPYCQDVLKRLDKTYKLIYLYGLLGRGLAQKWLDANRFPEAILLKNKGKEKIKQLHDRGVNIAALIGSAKLASTTAAYVENAITFSEAKDVEVVEDWQDIEDLIER